MSYLQADVTTLIFFCIVVVPRSQLVVLSAAQTQMKTESRCSLEDFLTSLNIIAALPGGAIYFLAQHNNFEEPKVCSVQSQHLAYLGWQLAHPEGNDGVEHT